MRLRKLYYNFLLWNMDSKLKISRNRLLKNVGLLRESYFNAIERFESREKEFVVKLAELYSRE